MVTGFIRLCDQCLVDFTVLRYSEDGRLYSTGPVLNATFECIAGL